jgi:hypothetical protein
MLMDRSAVAKDIAAKFGAYSWVMLDRLDEDEQVSATVTLKDNSDADSCSKTLKSKGLRLSTAYGSKVNTFGSLHDLLGIARMDCVERIELGTPVGMEDESSSSRNFLE